VPNPPPEGVFFISLVFEKALGILLGSKVSTHETKK
jgi:hypothetical protein